MAEIINLNESPVARLTRQVEERDQTIEALRAELDQTKAKLGMIISINEMLRLQLQDFLNTIENLQGNLVATGANLRNLQNKLPKF